MYATTYLYTHCPSVYSVRVGRDRANEPEQPEV